MQKLQWFNLFNNNIVLFKRPSIRSNTLIVWFNILLCELLTSICRVRDVADLIPQCNPDGTGHILKPEFRNTLNKMGFYMDDIEFERLWMK